MKVAAYCRVSTEREDQSNSFEGQMRFFREYINRQDGWELYKIYADEGITGTSTVKRRAFNHMITDARDRKFKHILTKEVSRFARNTVDTLQYTRELKKLGIGVTFLNDGINTLEADAELRLSIMGSIAQEESRKTSTRVKWGQMRRMEQGVVFGRSLLGYDVKDGKMTINPEGAKLVQLIFNKYVYERKSIATIARELREAGYKTFHGGVEWHRSVILKILRNEKYCGNLCQKKTITMDYLTHQKKYNHGEEELVIIQDHHKPIISHELWNMAQSELDRRKTNRRNTSGVFGSAGGNQNEITMAESKKNREDGISRRYPLSGKIRCAECGKSFVSRQRNVERKAGSDKKSYRTWRCGTTVRLGKCHIDEAGNRVGCNVSYQLRNDMLVEIIQQSVEQVLMQWEIDKKEIAREIADLVGKMQNSSQQDKELKKKQIEQKLLRLREKKIKTLDAFFSGIIGEEDFQLVNREYDEKIERAELDLRKLEERNSLQMEKSSDIQKEMEEKVWKLMGTKKNIEDTLEEQNVGEVSADSERIIKNGNEVIIYENLVENIFVYPNRRIELYLKYIPYVWCYELR